MRINKKIRKFLSYRLRKIINRNTYWDWDREKIIEFFLLDFNEDLDKAWAKINALYDRVLHEDPNWHFFYEGKYSIIRCSQKFEGKVIKFFKEFDIQYEFNGQWIDGSSTVCKYNKIFQSMFHCFSKLAINMDETELFNVADRVIHCFFNHAYYMAKDHKEIFTHPHLMDPMMWEAEMMAKLSVYRAHYIGKYTMERYIEKMAKGQKEKAEKEKLETDN